MPTKITIDLIKDLRDKTGVSVMQCKNALEEAEGDMEKALIILKNKSSSIAMKKANRNAKDGLIIVREDDQKTILLALHSETDFVAKNSDFVNLANKLADIAIKDGIGAVKNQSTGMINEIIQKVGEKIELGEISEIKGNIIGSYVHSGGKIAAIVVLSSGTKELARDIAMHITAMKPVYKTKDDITDEDKARVTEVYKKEVETSDKPQEIKDKMLEGKISSYFKELTLMNQMFIKNPDLSIEKMLKENNAQLESYIYESIN